MTKDNHFIFQGSRHLPGVTVLNAEMNDFSYKKHAHEEIALGVTLSGLQDFRCLGSHFKSKPGNIILFNPEEVHDGNPGTSAPLKYVMLYIHPREISTLINAPEGPELSAPRISGTLLHDEALKRQIFSLARCMTTKGSSRLEKELHLYEIATWFARRTGKSTEPARSRGKDKALQRVREYIHDNLQQDISIDALCNVAHISKYHFIRLFRGQFGITPHQYVLNCKVNRARTIIGSGTPASRTAQMCGFADASHLNRHFKRTYGITPKQYQQQIAE